MELAWGPFSEQGRAWLVGVHRAEQALTHPGGGVDITKPDSIVSRLQAYWDAIASAGTLKRSLTDL